MIGNIFQSFSLVTKWCSSLIKTVSATILFFVASIIYGCVFQPPVNHITTDVVQENGQIVFKGYKKRIKNEIGLSKIDYYLTGVEVLVGDNKAWSVICSHSNNHIEHAVLLPDSIAYAVSPCGNGTVDVPAIKLPYGQRIDVFLGVVGVDRNGNLKTGFSVGKPFSITKNNDEEFEIVEP